MDLNDFKEVNDNDGQHIGDKLLINLPQRMQKAWRYDGMLASIGDD